MKFTFCLDYTDQLKQSSKRWKRAEIQTLGTEGLKNAKKWTSRINGGSTVFWTITKG